MSYQDRPTEMLKRQQAANRLAARYRNPETGRRLFAHDAVFRAAFVRDMLAIRGELRSRLMAGQQLGGAA